MQGRASDCRAPLRKNGPQDPRESHSARTVVRGIPCWVGLYQTINSAGLGHRVRGAQWVLMVRRMDTVSPLCFQQQVLFWVERSEWCTMVASTINTSLFPPYFDKQYLHMCFPYGPFVLLLVHLETVLWTGTKGSMVEERLCTLHLGET